MIGRTGSCVALAIVASLLLGVVGVAWAAPGALDTTFGSGGVVMTDFGTIGVTSFEGVSDAAIQPTDQKIAVAGTVQQNGGRHDLFVARYLPNGTPDQSFGTGGVTITDLGADAYAEAIALTSTGDVMVAGESNFKIVVVRYGPEGTLDASFGTGGVATVSFPGSGAESASGVLALSGGKVLVSGSVNEPTNTSSSFALAQLTSSGALDPSFSGDGLQVTSVQNASIASFSMRLTPTDRIVVVGWDWPAGSDIRTAVARYRSNGALDKSFGRSGLQVVDVALGNDDYALDVAIGSGGGILALVRVQTPRRGPRSGSSR